MALPPLVIALNVLLALAGLGAILYAIAVTLDNDTRRHRLCVEAHTLHNDYQRRLAELRGERAKANDPLQDVEPDFEAIPIDEIGAAPAEAPEPAEPAQPRMAA